MEEDFKSRERLEMILDVVLIITVPALLLVNVWLFSTATTRSQENQARQRALSTGQTIAAAVQPNIGFMGPLQKQVEALQAQNDEIEQIDIAIPKDDGSFTIVASSEPSARDQQTGDTQLLKSYQDQQTIASSVRDGAGYLQWDATSPVFEGNSVLATAQVRLTMPEMQDTLKNNQRQAYAIAVTSSIVIVLFLLNHLRFLKHQIVRWVHIEEEKVKKPTAKN